MSRQDTQFEPGHSCGFKKGQSGNPGGKSKLEREYRVYLSRLFEPEIRQKAWDCLTKAIGKNERWAVERYFAMVERMLPQQPVNVSVTADLTVARKEYDEQLEFITRELARYAAAGRTAADPVEIEPGSAPLQLAPVLETESD